MALSLPLIEITSRRDAFWEHCRNNLGIARLLVQNPHALLADEPVSSLDPARAEALVALLVEMARAGGHGPG